MKTPFNHHRSRGPRSTVWLLSFFAVLAVVLAACTSSSPSTVPSTVTSPTTETSTTLPSNTAPDPDPSTTTSVAPTNPDLEIIASQAPSVVRDFLKRLTVSSLSGTTPLSEDDPFVGPARYYQELWDLRRQALAASNTAGFVNPAWRDPLIVDAQWKVYQYLPAGSARITSLPIPELYTSPGLDAVLPQPTYENLYYVEGIYGVRSPLITGTVSGFQFTVEDGRAILTDLVVFEGSDDWATLTDPVDPARRGWWLADTIVTDTSTTFPGPNSTANVTHAVVTLSGADPTVYLALNYTNLTPRTLYLNRDYDTPPTGAIAPAYESLLADSPLAGSSGRLSIMITATVPPSSSIPGALWQVLPSAALDDLPASLPVFETFDLDSVIPVGTEVSLAGTIDISLRTPTTCTVIGSTDDPLQSGACSDPRTVYTR